MSPFRTRVITIFLSSTLAELKNVPSIIPAFAVLIVVSGGVRPLTSVI